MSERFQTGHRELDDLFERYRVAPKGHVFAPLADACRKAGMLEEALEICARGVGEHPRYASGYVVQGKCLYDAGRARDAQAAFDRVLELDPKNLVALKYLGILHSERGETRVARGYFEHILALDPGDRDIRSRMEDVTYHEPAGRSTKVPSGEATRPAPPASAPVEMAPQSEDAPAEAALPDIEEPVLLPDVADEEFRGETITLRDESVTSDEIATMTLADIYASQGYTTRALRIYREVHKRQPANRALAVKIETLEREEAASKSAARSAPELRVEAPRKQRSAPMPVREVKPEPAAKPDAPAQGTAATGHPIDPSRNYEQFKRWLKASSK
jgi:tetratricopeptide (TPR) repeat protein